jgi:hypothetical protein
MWSVEHKSTLLVACAVKTWVSEGMGIDLHSSQLKVRLFFISTLPEKIVLVV